MQSIYVRTLKMDIIKTKVLVDTVRQVFVAERERSDKFVADEDLDEILSEEDGEPLVRESIIGYPTRPLYRELASMLHKWILNKKCPVLELPDYDLLDEKSYKEARAANIASLNPQLDGLQSLWSCWSQDERIYAVREILVTIGRRGLLDLLGLRKTVGSFDYWPPSRQVIEETFNIKHKLPSDLSVGARALAKHGHRDESVSWWGVSTGSEAAKNKHAEAIIKKILDGATWINIHQLIHDVRIVEVRQENGYGARWTCDGQSFRGFLEPQMVDGHEVGWKH